MIEVRLFGGLHNQARGSISAPGAPVQLATGEGETLGQVLHRLGITPEEISNVFLNGRLLPRSTYPMALGYLMAADSTLSPEECWAMPVQPGDRVGIFSRKTGLVIV